MDAKDGVSVRARMPPGAGPDDFSFLESLPDKVSGEFVVRVADGEVTVEVRSLDLGQLGESSRGAPPVAGQVIERLVEKLSRAGSYGVKAGRRVYAGYDGERKVRGRADKEERRGKFYYAGRDFSRENTDLPAGFRDRVVCGDAQSVLGQLPGNSVDLVLTSPPYNFGLDYEASEDGVDWEDYFDKLFAVLEECVRVTKFGGRVVVNVQPLFSDYVPLHHKVSSFLMDKGLIWRGEVLWEKSNYNCKYTAWGSWKSPSSPYLKYTWEFLEVFSKGSLRKEGDASDADITAEEFKEWVYAKWKIAPEGRMKEWGHPAMFPEELARRAIKLFSFRGDTVLDPFNGVGTTTKVARDLQRGYLGIDISEEYCEKARERLG